ncbi:MAG TPA: hypothetical protein VFY28_00885, partial [Candidatus Paceibacterota bacterium]|nr:hypothetical protein [Candidatus Paceibacterota bacterium]
VLAQYFGVLMPRAPFLLITRSYQQDLTGRRFPDEWVDTHYYVGRLSGHKTVGRLTKGGGPPFGAAMSSVMAGFAVRTAGFYCFPRVYSEKKKDLTERGTGEIEFRYYDFAYTPILTPFIPPLDIHIPAVLRAKEKKTGIPVFSLAVGFDAIEELCRKETERSPDFLKWFVRVSQQLGWPHLSEETREVHAELKQEVVAKLLASLDRMAPLETRIARVEGSVGRTMMEGGALTIVTDKVAATLMTTGERDELKKIRRGIQDLLVRGRDLGMDMDTDWVEVGGLSYQPARVLQDFEALFPA